MSDTPNPTIEGGRLPSDLLCKVIFEDEQQEPATPNKPLGVSGRRRSLVSSEPQHVTLIVFGIGMVNRTHLEADIGGLTMEAELKKIHGSFTLKEKMKGGRRIWSLNGILFICIKFLIKNMIAIQLVWCIEIMMLITFYEVFINIFCNFVSADILHQKMTETCASAHIGGVNIVLLEGITPDIQYVQRLLLLLRKSFWCFEPQLNFFCCYTKF